ncbi:MAG: hypothetical protein A3D44_03310 [Candidatus Staskawiczbacteria bacterium RIFCSPHIGHO2_02_FULL_42_22]|uniref:Uncharacterized protein n=1 Tax=Candidatus Staskawiczbacteria bacterium RIFCSPHIGHO2_02_FULL_42_22 TaxID=1802207 RepID=A0A1G2I4M5_9BACT|nr:MAG: hypothetical protein A3D44_03310 [Candidatus Staskawiczbacteria bacterium RIFCSPHIGHO2_02_FULL_42_22]
MNPDELLVIISEILKDLEIPYAITGGFAVTIWGKPRYTADIDIIVEIADKNIKPLVKKLLAIDKDVHADEDMIREALMYHGEFNFIHPDTGLKVDFFVQDNNLYNKLKIKRAVVRDIFDHKIPFVSPEDLILSKLMWSKENQSQKQAEDIKSVLRNPNITLDMMYLKNWAQKQETIGTLEELIEMIKLEK